MRVSRAALALCLAALAAVLVVVVSTHGLESVAARTVGRAGAASVPAARSIDGVSNGVIATNRAGRPLAPVVDAPGRHVYDLGNGVQVYAYWTPGARNVPSVTMVHGGYWRYGSPAVPYYLSWAEREQARGWAAFSVSYRLVPTVSWPAPLDDVERAINWIRAHADRFGLASDKSFLVGHSSGGQLASIAGLQLGGFAGVASISGADDPLEEYRTAPNPRLRQSAAMLVGDRVNDHALWESTRAVNYLGPHVMPFLVMQSLHDPTVPIATGRAMAAALATHGYPLTKILVPGKVHALVSFDDLSQIDRWFDMVLIDSEQRQLIGHSSSGG